MSLVNYFLSQTSSKSSQSDLKVAESENGIDEVFSQALAEIDRKVKARKNALEALRGIEEHHKEVSNLLRRDAVLQSVARTKDTSARKVQKALIQAATNAEVGEKIDTIIGAGETQQQLENATKTIATVLGKADQMSLFSLDTVLSEMDSATSNARYEAQEESTTFKR